MDAARHFFVVTVLRVEARAVLDHNMFMIRILLFDLKQERFGPIQVHCWYLKEYGAAIDYVDRSVAIAPLVFTFPVLVRTLPLLRPNLWQVRQ